MGIQMLTCTRCGGDKADPDSRYVNGRGHSRPLPCKVCKGAGRVPTRTPDPCRACRGRQSQGCYRCNGSGVDPDKP